MAKTEKPEGNPLKTGKKNKMKQKNEVKPILSKEFLLRLVKPKATKKDVMHKDHKSLHQPTNDVILESKKTANGADIPTKPKKKKLKQANIIDQKKIKVKPILSKEEENPNSLYQPANDKLLESQKLANTINSITNRKKKKMNQLKRLEMQKEQSEIKDITRNKKYIEKWKKSRTEWKYEKLRQVSIQQSAFNETQINNELWPLALEYLSTSRGASREHIITIAQKILDELDKECSNVSKNSEEQQKIISSTKYQRARELLQNFE